MSRERADIGKMPSGKSEPKIDKTPETGSETCMKSIPH